MEGFSSEFIVALRHLLPGFIAAVIFQSLTKFPKPTQFEMVICALLYLAVISFVVLFLEKLFLLLGQLFVLGQWNTEVKLVLDFIVALILGIVFAFSANKDIPHKYFRKFNLTVETSYPSEWYGTFIDHQGFISLYLKDERVLMGQLLEWPSVDGKGHFILHKTSWIGESEPTPLIEENQLIISVDHIKFVELHKEESENDEV